MTGNMSCLSEYEEIDGGYVAFGGDPKGGKITGKGKFSTGKLDFEDVYFVKELKFNLFSVLQMCDKKNSVLFTDTECVVLSHDFKLLDESQVLLRVPRKNKMYSVYLKNVTPSGGSEPTWLFDIDTLTKSINYKPVITGNQSNCSAGKARVETIPDKNYILLPLWTQDPLFSSSSKESPSDGFKPSGEEEKKDAKDPGNEDYEGDVEVVCGGGGGGHTWSKKERCGHFKDQEMDCGACKQLLGEGVYGCVDDPYMPNLEEIVYSDEDKYVGAEADMTNLDTNILVNPIPTTRIHKDHPVEQIIRDIHSASQTRMMTKNVTNYGFEDPEFPDRVYRVEKASYGLHQAPRAWSTRKEMCTELEKMMHKKFQMSSMGELTFFLGLQVTQKEDGIFISQDKYVDKTLKKFGFSTVKTVSTPMETSKPLLKDENAEDIDVLWIQNQMLDYGYNFMNTKIFIDNESTICIVKNPVFHSKTKHIKIRHYFIKDSNEKKLIQMIKIHTDQNVTDLLTKAFDVGRFQYLIAKRELVRIKIDDGNAFWNEIRVYTGISKVNAAGKKVSGAARQKLMLLDELTTARLPLALQLLRVYLIYKKETSCIAENADFVEIVDFLNAKPIRVERAATTTASLDAKHDSGTINRTQSTEIPNEPIPQGTGLGGSLRRQDTILGDRPAQTRFERLSKQSHEPPLSRVNTLRSGEDNMKLMELMALCTTLSDRVLVLENNKTAHELEITHLKKRVKRLEKKRKSRNPQLKRRLFKVRKEYSAEKSLGDQEDASKQEKNDQDERISFVQKDAEIQERYGHDTKINTASTSITTASINITTAEPVTTVSTPITTAGVSISTAERITPTTTKTTVNEDEDLTITQILMKMRRVILREASKTTTRPTIPPQHLLDPKDKGKVKMVEPKKPLKKKDQIEFDKKVAQRLHAQFEEEERMARQQEEKENIAECDDVQAMMDADHELAERLQAKEQGELYIEERLKLFVELMNQRRKHFTRIRAEEKRRKPPTKAQKRNQMLDKEKLDEKVEAKVDNDQEEAEMKIYMKIVPDDEIAIDAIPLATKPPIIIDWKIIKEGNISPYHIKRADGSSKKFSFMIQML
uniref:Retrotransposon protein, putative, unclassified n=1 Tax=Tanacetum cinerariifolium TaxID=118510 RepID=A0A6L2KT94_TANCI|nr:retrotransposon protein, putative, unclassified [Tanacetum cinerariifolium]